MEILENEPLAKHTTMKVGGNARIFLPETEKEFVDCMKEFFEKGFFILGGGSNIIAPDEGLSRPVISTKNLKSISLKSEGKDGILECGCGCTWTQVCNFSMENGFSGAEDFSGLPGTIGGAVFMNARCFSTEVSDILESVRYFDTEKHEISEYKMNKTDWDYKKSPFNSSKKIVLSAKFRISKSDLSNEELKALFQKAIDQRKSKRHYDSPSAGSVFKNNHDFGSPSGKIIDECGLKGEKIGGAQVAPWHGNFIINTGNAKASDIKSLVEKIKSSVKEKTGFSLEEEIIFW